ncbi:MAG: DUF3667 domain-containing protein [Saprospiraceae bacterium]|nr:DUF3667 domain-containing protein [Saprospiraceae bacterium]
MPLDEKPADTRYCPNCHYPMRSGSTFCSECGQKFTTGRVTLWQLSREFVGSIFDIDSKIFRTLRDLLSPGKLTVEYFKGRQRRYVHPARLFLFTALIHFAALGLVLVEARESFSDLMENRKRNLHRNAFIVELDSLSNKVLEEYAGNEQVDQALDTLRNRLGGSGSTDSTYTYYYHPQKKEFVKVGAPSQEVFDLRTDDLLDKCGIEGAIPRFQVGQFFRINKEGDNFLGFMLGNLVWLVALMMPTLALLLKLLYIRRKKYFVEHLVFSFHYHAFAFLLFTITFLMGKMLFSSGSEDVFEAAGGSLLSISFIGVLIYLFMAMRRVYGQGFLKTFIKFSIVNFSYVFIFVLSLVLTLFGGALLF